ncbi:MAG: hypothetical protein Q4B26_14780 [Eubacteriales bacterium]|nr:hypothetical protein [Eubacteriales bacterium]
MSREVSRFTVGGTAAGPSIPAGPIAAALGTKIIIDMFSKSLIVPTTDGMKRANQGDTVVAYEDGSFDVEVNS